jgi:hypothetical protein
VDARAGRFHRDLALHPNAVTPFSYVYSPITFPLLRVIGAMPLWFSGIAYWIVYTAADFVSSG